MIRNFSRHQFNADQTALLQEIYPDQEIGNPLSPFWANGVEFLADVKNTTASAVVPANILGEALYLLSQNGGYFIIISWINCPQARARGRFACKGATTQYFSAASGATLEIGKPAVYPWEPTMENDFRTNEAFIYEG